MVTRLRLTSGMHLLEEWSANACQADRNMVYQALFSVADGTVFGNFDVVEVDGRPHQFLVLVRPGLVVRIRLFRPDAFGIVHLGPAVEHRSGARRHREGT